MNQSSGISGFLSRGAGRGRPADNRVPFWVTNYMCRSQGKTSVNQPKPAKRGNSPVGLLAQTEEGGAAGLAD
nr:hypothetical protein [Escherichia coli O25b:H4-ST131]